MNLRTQLHDWLDTHDRGTRLREAVLPFVVLGVLFAALIPVNQAAHRDWFDFTVIIVAFMALFFGFVQYRDAHRHTKKMEDIAKTMSTRYIGALPKDLDDIAEVVSKADHDFVALASFVSYGQYAKPEAFDRLLQEVKAAKRRKVNVRLYVYGDEPAKKTLELRFPPNNWTAESQSESFHNFFAFNPGMSHPVSHQEFLNMYRRLEDVARSQLVDKGVRIYLLNGQERLYFWLADDKDAVFSIASASGGDPLCFRTRDGRMIETFQRILKSYPSLPSYLDVKKAPRPQPVDATPRAGPDISGIRVHSIQAAASSDGEDRAIS